MIRKLLLVLAILSLLATRANAATALTYTSTVLQRARAIVAGNQPHNEKLAALSALFAGFLDTDAMGREALGQHWSSFNPAQQKEFLSLFRELLDRTYVQKLLLFENPIFDYAGQQTSAAGTVVDTKIVTPRDQFDVKYWLICSGNVWQVKAITVEDVSLTANLASQLNDLLSRMSVEDLLALMRRKYGNTDGRA